MAEETVTAPGRPQGRQIIIIATVATVVFFSLILIGLRSCSSSPSKKESKNAVAETAGSSKISSSYVVIYSNLELRDAALVITRLKELKIPYQTKDEGRSIAVPRARSDEARLGLAEKNLPAGGSVGWEIFDQSKLGATDFDRRIQFIRAMSGELSRTISRISAIEDARVQIVIPETKLFEAAKAPVTASVMLKLNMGQTLSAKQVNAIVYLVAGSVENLQKENVCIIDTNGNILAGGGYTPPTTAVERENIPEAVAPIEQVPQGEGKEAQQVVISKPEEKETLDMQAKLDLEDRLSGKVQSLLNKIYPPNITIAKVNVDSIKSKKLTVIILLDNKYKMNPSIKRVTFDTISAAVGYDKARGDKIIMKGVKFHVAGSIQPSGAPVETSKPTLRSSFKKVLFDISKRSATIIFILIALLIGVWFVLSRTKKNKVAPEIKEEQPVEAPNPEAASAEQEGSLAAEEVPVVEEMKSLASQNPEAVANLIKTWLTEEGA